MKPLGPSSALCAAIVAAWVSGLPGAPVHASTAAQVAVRKAPAIATLNGFVSNGGQWAPEVLFFAKRGGIEATLLADALVFRPTVDPECAEPAPEPLVLRLPGAAAGRVVEGAGELPTMHHFILASGSASDVRSYETVLYRDVQPGIDVRLRFDGERFAYDLLLDLGADLGKFVLGAEGAESLEVVDGTTLVMQAAGGVVEQRIGASWQEHSETGEREPVAAAFREHDSTDGAIRFGFDVPRRDASRALVIDPTLSWATYVGGSGQELLKGMALDAEGRTFLLCTASPPTPTTPGSLLPTPTPGTNLWVGRLSSGGTDLDWGTFLGGASSDQAERLSVDQDGTVVVLGQTWSTDFPTTPGAFQPVHGGGSGTPDLFVARLHASGSSLVWSTLLGQTVGEVGDALALMPSGDVVVAAHHTSPTDPLPATPGAFDPVYDEDDGMLFRLTADGSGLIFLTYFISLSTHDIAIDGLSNIYFAGGVSDEEAPLVATPGAFKEGLAPGDSGSDGFIAKMDPLGTEIEWATLLGGVGDDTVWGIAVDAGGAIYATGRVGSVGFPVSPGAFDLELTGGNGGFVTKLLPNGSDLVWSTHLGPECACGGSGYTSDIAVDAAGNAHVLGSANEPGWPTTLDALQTLYVGPFPSGDAVLTKLDALGETLVYSTWFGGDGSDSKGNLAIDSLGRPHIALHSGSDDLPVSPGAYQSTNAGSTDIVVAQFDLPLLPWRILGGGLKGAEDEPNLAGTGTLTPNSPTRLSVRGAFPSSIGWFFVGFTTIDLPFLGGTLVPWPNIYFSWPTDPDGAIDLPFSWPGLPSGSSLYFQYWVIDLGGPEFFAATGAIQAISQAP